MVNRQIWPDEAQPVEDLEFQAVEPTYVKVLTARIALTYVLIMGVAFIIPLTVESYGWWLLLGVESALVIAMAVNIALIHRIYSVKGYALRNCDVSYRSGLFFTSVKTVPFSKIQQVSVRTNPLSRMFRLYHLDIINGSQSAGNVISIPGLTHDKAERLKSILINKDSCKDGYDE